MTKRSQLIPLDNAANKLALSIWVAFVRRSQRKIRRILAFSLSEPFGIWDSKRISVVVVLMLMLEPISVPVAVPIAVMMIIRLFQ